MDKILERLKLLAQNGNQDADRLYVDLFEINQAGDGDAAALWMVENEPALREVLSIDVVQNEAMNAKEPEMLELAKQYAELHNAGASMFSGNDKLSPSGKKLNTLDDFIAKSNYQGSINDDVRAAFTNPENPQYWKNMDDVAKTESAMLMGYDNVADWERDLDREARMFQTRNRVEGWDANNSLNPIKWVGSTLLGLGAPRVKDAMLAGRDISKEDIIGDMAELGLNFVPGVGLVGKGGNIVKRIAVNSAEALAVPLGTNALDLALYSGDPTNPRGDTDPVNFAKRVAAQTAGIAGAKGTVKAAGMGAKNFAEQLEGGQSGKDFIRNFGEALDDIGTKTEDIIKRRQLALDRKAELASQRKNVEMPGDNDVRSAVNSYTPDDVINAEDFRNLVNEARRLKQSEPIRQTYNTAMETASDAGGRNARNIAEQYRTANEASPDMLFQLDDGRIVRGVRLSDNGLAYSDVNYVIPLKKNSVTPLEYRYDDPYNDFVAKDRHAENTAEDWFGKDYIRKDDDLDPIYASRNPAVRKRIENDRDLQRLMRSRGKVFENARDVVANVGYDALAREGLVGDLTSLDEQREKAMWNNVMRKMRPLTANAKIPPEERKVRVQAIMDVMTYGLNGLPTDVYNRNPRVYKLIAEQMGQSCWKHPSEKQEPTTSYSSAF